MMAAMMRAALFFFPSEGLGTGAGSWVALPSMLLFTVVIFAFPLISVLIILFKGYDTRNNTFIYSEALPYVYRRGLHYKKDNEKSANRTRLVFFARSICNWATIVATPPPLTLWSVACSSLVR